MKAAPLLSAVLALGACSGKPAADAGPEAAAQARGAPDFELPDLGGKRFRLSSLKDRVVLMEFWATWCEPCRDSAPYLQRLSERYRGDGLSVVGVNVDAEAGSVARFVTEHRVSYPVVLDPDSQAMELYRVRGIPNLFLVDRQGRLRKRWVGWDDSLIPALEGSIRALLQEKA